MRELVWTLQNLRLSLSLAPFDWFRFQLGVGQAAVWAIVGPIDIGVEWGG
jgi:hypothetical protein